MAYGKGRKTKVTGGTLEMSKRKGKKAPTSKPPRMARKGM